MYRPIELIRGSLALLIILIITNSAHPAKIGLFAGTFDPPHPTHELIVQSAISLLDLDEVIIFVNQNPKNKPNASPYFHRLEMARIVFQKIPEVRIMSGIDKKKFHELDIDYYDNLAFKNPKDQFYALAGSDLFPRGMSHIYNIFSAKNLSQVVFLRNGDEFLPATDDVLVFGFDPADLASRLRSSTAIRYDLDLLNDYSPQFKEIFEYIFENKLHYNYKRKCEGRFTK